MGVNGCSVDSPRKSVIHSPSSLFFFLRLHIHLCWQLRWPSDDRRFDLRPSPPPLSDTIKPIAKLPRFCFIRNTRFLLSFKLLPSNFSHCSLLYNLKGMTDTIIKITRKKSSTKRERRKENSRRSFISKVTYTFLE